MTDFTITEDFPRSEIEFDARFSNPEACYQYHFQLKWADGFLCKRCGCKQYWLSSRNLYICTQCEHQHSLTARTIMDSSKKPITYWFKAMWWFTTRKSRHQCHEPEGTAGLWQLRHRLDLASKVPALHGTS